MLVRIARAVGWPWGGRARVACLEAELEATRRWGATLASEKEEAARRLHQMQALAVTATAELAEARKRLRRIRSQAATIVAAMPPEVVEELQRHCAFTVADGALRTQVCQIGGCEYAPEHIGTDEDAEREALFRTLLGTEPECCGICPACWPDYLLMIM